MTSLWTVYFYTFDGLRYVNTVTPQVPINAVKTALSSARDVSMDMDAEVVKVEIEEMEKVIASWTVEELQKGLSLNDPPSSMESL